MTWENELEQIIETAEMAHESAMSELEVFGDCQGWFFGSCDTSCTDEGLELYEDDRMQMWDGWDVSDEWRAWESASEDIPMFFEVNLSI